MYIRNNINNFSCFQYSTVLTWERRRSGPSGEIQAVGLYPCCERAYESIYYAVSMTDTRTYDHALKLLLVLFALHGFEDEQVKIALNMCKPSEDWLSRNRGNNSSNQFIQSGFTHALYQLWGRDWIVVRIATQLIATLLHLTYMHMWFWTWNPCSLKLETDEPLWEAPWTTRKLWHLLYGMYRVAELSASWLKMYKGPTWRKFQL